MAHPSADHRIEDIYRGVINDVIAQVKEAFYDDNVDIEVLQQLRKSWEQKVNASGVVDLDGTRQLHPPAMRQPNRQMGGHRTAASNVASSHGGMPNSLQTTSSLVVVRNTQHNQQPQHAQPPVQAHQQPIPTHMPANAAVRYIDSAALAQGQGSLPTQNTYRIIQNPGQASYIIPEMNAGQNIVVLPSGQHIGLVGGQQIAFAGGMPGQPQIVQATAIRQDQPPQRMMAPSKVEPGTMQVHQLDGAACDDLSEEKSDNEEPQKPVKKWQPTKIALSAKKHCKKTTVAQVDGGPGMDDESSSEGEMEDDEDPLHRLAGLDDDAADDEEVTEEDPLNTDDDQSDDEDVETLFEADNVVICQFEKVHRARSKWKFTLKDGIMHIKGKDYCFQKCLGEAEW